MILKLETEQITGDWMMERAREAGLGGEMLAMQEKVARFFKKAKYFQLDAKGEEMYYRLEDACLRACEKGRATTEEAGAFVKQVMKNTMKLHAITEIQKGNVEKPPRLIPHEYVVYAWRYTVEDTGKKKFAPEFVNGD